MRANIVELLSEKIKTEKTHLNLSKEDLESLISEMVKKYLSKNKIKKFNYIKRLRLEKDIYYRIRGLGVIDKLLELNNINEIMINGHNKVFYEINGVVKKSSEVFRNKKELLDLIEKIANKTSKAVNLANPIMDTRLADGSRVNVVLPPLSVEGPVITIRVFNKKMLGIEGAIKNHTLTQEAARFLEMLVKHKYNIFISGGTSSGKTTLLNMLSNFIPQNERVITIEDNAELKINQIENIVKLEARKHKKKNLNVTIGKLIKTALRMRPDRIIVGEVRGKEAIDMLQAMNTGHDGSISTGHANSTRDMINRLEMMILSSPKKYPLEFIKRQIASSIDIIVHMTKDDNNKRKIAEISEVIDYKEDKVNLQKLYLLEKNCNGLPTLVKKNELKNNKFSWKC
jgi:pilus assembly protein CpaF